MKNNLKLMDEIKIKNLFFKIVKKKKGQLAYWPGCSRLDSGDDFNHNL